MERQSFAGRARNGWHKLGWPCSGRVRRIPEEIGGAGPTGLDSLPGAYPGGFVELDQLSVVRRFVHDLKQLRQRAGQPSYSTLERLSKHRLKRATVSDVLNDNRVNLPDWRFVAAFVEACHAAAGELGGIDTAELGTIADWKRHWDGAYSGVIGARFPGRGQPSVIELDSAEATLNPSQLATSAGHLADQGTTGPGDIRPSVWGPVPPRLPDFVGRQGWLTDIHRALAAKDCQSLVAIQGMLGIG